MALARYQGTVTDESGNVVPLASVEVRREIFGSPLAALKADRDGVTPLSNPMTADENGFFAFHVIGGAYRIEASKVIGGDLWEAPTLRYVALGLGAESDQIPTSQGVDFLWSTSTDSSDPGAGYLKINNAALASATTLYVSESDANGIDVSALLAVFDDSTTTSARGVLFVRKVGSPETFAAYQITSAVTDGGDFDSWTISHIASNGTLDADDAVQIQFWRTGDNGAGGADGSPGISGTSALTRVRVVATSNVSIATALESGDTLDGAMLVTNDLVLLSAQTDPEDNGVYVVQGSGAAVRHSDFDAYDDLPGTYFSVMEGTAKEDTLWRCSSDRGGTIGTDPVVISEFVGGGGGVMPAGTIKGSISGGSPEDLTAVQARTILNTDRPRFLVHKNGTNQTGIATATDTKLTWATEVYDVGSYFDLGNSRWTPPAGPILITCVVQFSGGVVDQSTFQARIYKNGAFYAAPATGKASGTDFITAEFAFLEEANGTDYYEIYARGTGTGDKTVSGLAVSTFWMGVSL